MSHNLQIGRKTYFFLRRRKSKLATRQRAKKSITMKSSNQTTTKNPIHKEKHLTTKQQTANNCKTKKIIEKKNPLKILCNQPSTKPEPILMVLVQYFEHFDYSLCDKIIAKSLHASNRNMSQKLFLSVSQPSLLVYSI